MSADSSLNPVDLARESDFSLGPVCVRPSLRQVESAGGPETLEPRVMQVLVALTRRPAEVVSRDDLIQTCWSGRIVGEDAISRVIARIRRLGEAHDAFEIETIPRVGYRLLLKDGGAAPAIVTEPEDAEQTVPADASRPRRWLPWLMAGGAAAGVLAAALFVLRPSTPDVDAVVARLSDRLREDQRAAPGASDAVRQLGASTRAEERSAFAALASNDGEHALEILEDLARVLEASGDTKAAAQAWRRVGAIAPLFDDARAVAAQRKAFALDRESLGAFQNLFFVSFLQPETTLDFVREVLADPGLSARMRGWVLSHRAFFESDGLGNADVARATLAEIKALPTFAADPVLHAASAWIEALLAFNGGDLHSARSLAEKAMAGWSAIPEKTSNSPEGLLVRVALESGDWEGAFRFGVDTLERRSREGDLLPAWAGWAVCETGIYIGQDRIALPYCVSSVRRAEGPVAVTKAFAGVVATLEGDHARAAREFETAHGNVPPGGSIPTRVLIFEAWAAQKAGDLARAEQILATRPGGQTWDDATRHRPSVNAAAKRLLGEWLIEAGQPKRACAPLAEAARIYEGYGGDAGRDAVNAVRAAAGCLST